jgi:3-hydroxyacyl-CoA dehydrogenase
MDWKLDLYKKIAPFVAPHAIVASNTSGLSITKLSEVLPEEIKPRFCGIHFFNPPRYMHLVELINTPHHQPQILDDLEAFSSPVVWARVVRAKDTPNFIANRVGIAGMLATMKEVENFGLSYDVVDDLTGKKLGRASSRHLPHRGCGRSGHHGPRHQDAAGHTGRRATRSTAALPRRRAQDAA